MSAPLSQQLLILAAASLIMVSCLLFLRQKFRRQLELAEAAWQQRLAVLEEKLAAKEAQLLDQTASRQQAEMLVSQLRDDPTYQADRTLTDLYLNGMRV